MELQKGLADSVRNCDVAIVNLMQLEDWRVLTQSGPVFEKHQEE
jgi:hypothetical protein